MYASDTARAPVLIVPAAPNNLCGRLSSFSCRPLWLPGVIPFFRLAVLAAGVPVFPCPCSIPLSMEMLCHE